MPQQIDVTVKKADGTTDITYAKVVPSSGNNSPAIWRSPVGTAPAFKAEMSVRSAPNAANTVRRVEYNFKFPQVVTAGDGSESVSNTARFQLTGTIPQSMPQTLIDEAVHQCLNWFAHAHSKSQMSEGYAAS
jgi:hypothetical protein